MIIIPHNELSYLPFEILIDSSGHYLLDRFSTSYNYSASFLQKKLSGQNNDELIAFAPYATADDTNLIFGSIPASREEVNDLN
ncbi:CHAT domain-containing protein, partial [Pantoea sp. GbtcB22]|uniref:CHAT domain-containing protein n=1 Tax=Pantoea sp. GbtcB22 TaxID=2824767 RepID=UPI0034D2AB15